MTSCPGNYTSFLENIANDVGVLINNEPNCQNYISNEISLTQLTNSLGETGVTGLYSINLGDSSSDVRVKGKCLKNVLNLGFESFKSFSDPDLKFVVRSGFGC